MAPVTAEAPGVQLTPGALAAELARIEAHRIEFQNVGPNRYSAVCSCREWSGIVGPRTVVLTLFDNHLRDAHADREQARCFCGQLLIRSPFGQQPWYHARRDEFIPHPGIPADDVAAGEWRA
jgi:hypothetical protein